MALAEACRHADEICDRRAGHPPDGILLRGPLGTGK
jgi:ATP-dependent 26S proteasome regulatory subunit